MINFFTNLLIQYGMNKKLSFYLAYSITILGIIILSIIVDLITKNLLLRIIKRFVSLSLNKWADILLEKKVFNRLANIAPILVILAFSPLFPVYQSWIQRIAFSAIIIVILLTFNRLLDAIDDIYKEYEISKIRPIKGYLQVTGIMSYIIGIVVIISILINRSPLILLSGIGAATAVLMLIFKDSLLGLVASIQLSTNNMVQIGDWIEMPVYGANGTVIEITLHTVKVKNFNNTITTIPTYALISESFHNWSVMHESGARRIKRSIYIDMTSIKFCTDEMLERFERIQLLKDYLTRKKQEIEEYNKKHNIDSSYKVNGRHLTNIGTFRAYIEQYLKHHPRVHQHMTLIVRQLQPTENGLPIEVYVFANDTKWENYESIQSDIFDHILAVVPEFDLRVFQSPTSYDFKSIKN